MAMLPWRQTRGHWARKVRENLRWGLGGWVSHLFALNGHVRPNRVWLSEPWVINRVYNNISLASWTECPSEPEALNRGSTWKCAVYMSGTNIEKLKEVSFYIHLCLYAGYLSYLKLPLSDPSLWDVAEVSEKPDSGKFYFLAHKFSRRT